MDEVHAGRLALGTCAYGSATSLDTAVSIQTVVRTTPEDVALDDGRDDRRLPSNINDQCRSLPARERAQHTSTGSVPGGNVLLLEEELGHEGPLGWRRPRGLGGEDGVAGGVRGGGRGQVEMVVQDVRHKRWQSRGLGDWDQHHKSAA